MDKDRKKSFKKRIARIAVGMTVAIALIMVSKKWEENQLRVRLETMVRIHNRDCPRALNDFISIDSASTDAKITFTRHYTITNIDEEGKKNFTNLMKTEVVKTVKESENLDILKDDEIVFRFSYTDSSGSEFAVISVTPEEYK